MANQPTQTFYTRIQHKHDIPSKWLNSTFVPYAGEIIVYDPVAKDASGNYTEAPRFKIGDGKTTVHNLPFADDAAIAAIGTSLAQLELGAEGQKTTLSYGSTKISEVTVPYATNAGVAGKLGTETKGSATKGIYLNAGVPTEMTYELKKTVPADAKFTDTTYSDMVGATATAAGKNGLVPAPAKGEHTLFLRGDGEWATPTEAGTAGKVKNKLIIGDKEYNGSAEVTVTASDLGLGNALHFLGTSTTAITDGGTETPTISGWSGTLAAGDVVIYGSKEFIYTAANKWELFGDEGSYALKTITITAGSGLSGGGNLSANRTIAHGAKPTTGTDTNAGSGKYVSGIKLDTFGHVAGINTGTLPTIPNVSISGNDAAGNVITGMTASGHTITVTKGSFATQSDFTALKGKAVDSISSGSANGTIKYTIDGVNKGDVAVTGLKSAAYTESSDYAPKSHASTTASTYGAGNASKFGHVKIEDAMSDSAAANSVALSPKGLKTYAAGLNLATLNPNQKTTWVLFNCGTSEEVL